jgi:hypothetical protein
VRFVAVIGAFLVVAAPASAKLRNPCSLLTNAEVAKHVGGHVVTRTIGGTSSFAICTWAGPTFGYFGDRREVTVTINRSTKAQFEDSFTPGSSRIKGLGEAAFALSGGRSFLSVYQSGFTLDVTAPYSDGQLRAEKTLATAALERL